LADKLEVFDYLRASTSPLLSKNPAGFLRASIEKDFAPPPGYISRAERQRIKQAEEDARQRQREQAHEAQLAEQSRKDQIEAIWTSLGEPERANVEAEALARLNPFAFKCYTKEKAEGRVGSGHHALRIEVYAIVAQRLVPAGDSTIQQTTVG
jgi:hypothetical protein